jgi:hypothetical protein
MVIRECVWNVCVYISCTGDRQLWSSFVCKGRGGWVGQVRRIRVRACVRVCGAAFCYFVSASDICLAYTQPRCITG